MTWQVGATIKR